MGYDALNRLTSKNSSGSGCGTPVTTTYSYDVGVNGLGRRTGMSDHSGFTSWTYDGRRRMLFECKTLTGVGTYNTSWSYNPANLPTTITYPDGELLSNTYNNRMLLDALSGMISGTTTNYIQSTTYDAASRMSLPTLGNSTQTIRYPFRPRG